MSFMDDTDITYNGIKFANFGFLSVRVSGETPKHILAAAKTLNTVRPAYRTRSIAVGSVSENLTFNLTFSLLNKNFTEKFNELLYQILDVDTYKPLRFGTNDFYYNAIPFVGNVSEINFMQQHQGYVTIPFVCDAPHGWIDRHYSFSRNSGEEAMRWKPFMGEGNVKGGDGTYRVFPYLVIKLTTANYVSFALAYDEGTDADASDKTAKEPHWWTLYDLTPGDTLRIDGENMQFYSESGMNLLEHMNNEEFVFSLKSNDYNQIWHRGLENNPLGNVGYTIDMYVSYPVMR